MAQLSFNNVSIHLEDRLEDFDYYGVSPFVFFEKKNVLEDFVYEKLKQEIYSLEDFDYVFKGKGQKHKRSINGSNLGTLKEGVLKDFCRAFLKKSFFKWFEKTHLRNFESSKKIYFYIRKPNSVIFRVVKKLRTLLKVPVCFFYTEVEYSSIKQNGYISPHTDAQNKRLSFVYYIPKEALELNEDLKNDLGTVFWKSKVSAINPLRRFDCTFLVDDELEGFYRDYEPLYVAKYEPNKFAGFIKSDNSWHSVEPIQSNYDRRAIVINVWES